jgi:hypothetical protein
LCRAYAYTKASIKWQRLTGTNTLNTEILFAPATGESGWAYNSNWKSTKVFTNAFSHSHTELVYQFDALRGKSRLLSIYTVALPALV